MKVFQIYFDEIQLENLDYTPYYNKECTVFFENSVIRDLIKKGEHTGEGYFGVVSHKLRQKLSYTKNWTTSVPNISNTSTNEFTPELFETELMKHVPDVMSFQRHPGHDSISFANNFHPNFSKYFKEIMSKCGYLWEPVGFESVFYCNYFVAKSEIYERYAKEMLAPAMDVMESMPELMENSRYPKPLPDHLKKPFGVDYYPYHSFICERFFSFFAHIHNLKCLHY